MLLYNYYVLLYIITNILILDGNRIEPLILFIIIKQLKMVPSRDGTLLDQSKKYKDAVQRSLPYKIDSIRSGIRAKW